MSARFFLGSLLSGIFGPSSLRRMRFSQIRPALGTEEMVSRHLVGNTFGDNRRLRGRVRFREPRTIEHLKLSSRVKRFEFTFDRPQEIVSVCFPCGIGFPCPLVWRMAREIICGRLEGGWNKWFANWNKRWAQSCPKIFIGYLTDHEPRNACSNGCLKKQHPITFQLPIPAIASRISP